MAADAGNLPDLFSIALGPARLHFALVATPRSKRKHELADGTGVVQIGSCAGTEEAAEYVESFLLFRGILPVLHGSRAYAICVPENRAEEARQFLRSDPQRDQFGIYVYDD